MPSSGIVESYGSFISSFLGISILLSIMAVSFYIPTNSARGFPFLHTLSRIIICRFFVDSHSDRELKSGTRLEPRGVQWGGRWEGVIKRKDTYVYLWLIHVDIRQKPTQYCKAIILQLKIFKNVKKDSENKKIEKYKDR